MNFELRKEFLFNLRTIRNRKAYSFVLILTLGLGIGVCAAVFMVVNSVLLRPLPFQEPERLVLIQSLNKDATGKVEAYGVNLSDFMDWREQNRSFTDLAAMQPVELALTGNGQPEQVDAGLISANLFTTLGVAARLGRFFTSSDEVDQPNVAIISEGLWQRRFGGSAGVLTKTIYVDGIARQVVGVAPSNFFFAANADLWLPLNLKFPRIPRQPHRNTAVVGLLREGVSVQQASDEMKSLADGLAKQYPVNVGWSAHALPIREPYVRDVKNILWFLFAAVTLLLLVICINVANLVLVRVIERRSELGLRLALGANRKKLLLLFLMENLMLTFASGVLAAIVSALVIKPMVALSPIVGTSPAGNRILNSVSLDGTVLLFILIFSFLIGCALSLISFVQIAKSDFTNSLKEVGRKVSIQRYEKQFQKGFVVVQLSISFLLMIGASLVFQNFLRLKNIDPGFSIDNLLTARVALPVSRYDSHPKRAEFMRSVIEASKTIPGVKSVSGTTRLPLNEFAMTTFFEVDGIVNPENGFVANFRRIGPAYFQTMNTPVIDGREFAGTDSETGMPVAVISRTMAKRFWGSESPIGKRVRRTAQTDRAWRTIVGVVEDIKDSSLTSEPGLTLYIPYLQASIASFHLAVRTDSHPELVINQLRETVTTIDKDIPLFQTITAEYLFLNSLSGFRFAAYLLNCFALLALFIAVIGVYGVISYSTTRRVHEIGIRMAIGAHRQSILSLILQESARLCIYGILIGFVLSLFLERTTTSLWQGTGGPMLYVITIVTLVLTALISSLIPALRATRIDPTMALRYE